MWPAAPRRAHKPDCSGTSDVTMSSDEEATSQGAFGPPSEASDLTKKKKSEMSGRRKGALQAGADDWHLLRISASLIFFCVIPDRKGRSTDEGIAESE